MTEKGFNEIEHEKAIQHYREWGRLLLAGLPLKGGERILDLGCGNGTLTAQLAERVPDGFVLGIDAQEGQLEAARKYDKPNLQFLHVDAEPPDFRDEFDIVLSNAALHRVKDHRKLLQYVLTVLRPGGLLFWTFAGKGSCENFFSIIRSKLAESTYQPYFADFNWPWYMPSVEEYEILLGSAGFSDFTVQEMNMECRFKDPEDLLAWLDIPALTPFLSVLPPELQTDFRDEAAVEMIEQTRRQGGTYFESFRCILVKAHK